MCSSNQNDCGKDPTQGYAPKPSFVHAPDLNKTRPFLQGQAIIPIPKGMSLAAFTRVRKASLLIAFLAGIVATRPLPAQQPNRPLADLKAAAESGDAQAQDKLGDTYRVRGDFENAVAWYRRSAPHDIINSQYQLAHLLLAWAQSPSVTPSVRAMHFDEALPFLQKAATQGHKGAQFELGKLYCEGKLLTKDLPEAYKWFCLASDASPLDLPAGFAKSWRDGLILKMSADQIADGNQRLAKFKSHPGEPPTAPEPAYLQNLKLQGITGTPGRQLAIINGKTVSPNETATLKIDARAVTIHCLSITANTVTLSIDGISNAKTLILH